MSNYSFSKIFGLAYEQAELDFVDITPGTDLPLYIDPYALTTREDNFSIKAHELVLSFFESVITAVANKDKKKATELLSKLTEPEETFLGVSQDGNSGRGIGNIQAVELYDSISKSRAASSGLLEDLSDFALFIPGIGRDKISDITTNIIRKLLIDYTQQQCNLHGIEMRRVASGFYWCKEDEKWKQEFFELPVVESQKILLVPKHIVRYQVGVDHTRFRRMFVLEFLQEEHLRADDSLVTALRDKKGNVRKKTVFKKTVDKHYPSDKDFLADFSTTHPEILDKYRDTLKAAASKIPTINKENFSEQLLAQALKEHLKNITKGAEAANEYHNFCISVLSFLFFPNLINPKKEHEINHGRKRIDISYTNGKDSGLFYRVALDQHLLVNTVHVECKNYTNEIKNPEIDQLVARFDHNRGRFGLLMFRDSDNFELLKNRCSDVAKQRNGVILPLNDDFIIKCLDHVINSNRKLIDTELDGLFQEIIS